LNVLECKFNIFSRESPMRLLCLISVSIPTRLHFIQHYGA